MIIVIELTTTEFTITTITDFMTDDVCIDSEV
jgi:hypothetical protein